jgi:hypothetical protein
VCLGSQEHTRRHTERAQIPPPHLYAEATKRRRQAETEVYLAGRIWRAAYWQALRDRWLGPHTDPPTREGWVRVRWFSTAVLPSAGP